MLKQVQHDKRGKTSISNSENQHDKQEKFYTANVKKQYDILNTSVAQNTKKYKKNANKAKALFAFSHSSRVFRGSAPKRVLGKKGSLREGKPPLAK